MLPNSRRGRWLSASSSRGRERYAAISEALLAARYVVPLVRWAVNVARRHTGMRRTVSECPVIQPRPSAADRDHIDEGSHGARTTT